MSSAAYKIDPKMVFQRTSRFSLNVANEAKKEINKDGFLIQYDVPIARTGNFIYKAYELAFTRNDNIDPGTNLTFYRDESSFSVGVLSKNLDVPFTNDHPNGAVNTKNANRTIVGGVHDLYFKDGTLFAGRIVIHDEKTIEDIEQKGKKEVSIGFEASYSLQPENIDGKYFDGREQVIRINHLSLVNAGKAGPEFKMHHKQENEKMSQPETVKVTINGVELDLPADKAIALNHAKSQDRFESLSTSVNELTEKFNALVESFNSESKGDEPSKEDKKEDESKDKKEDESKDDKSDEKDESENKCEKNNKKAETSQNKKVEETVTENAQNGKNVEKESKETPLKSSPSFMCNSENVLSEEFIMNADHTTIFSAIHNKYYN